MHNMLEHVHTASKESRKMQFACLAFYCYLHLKQRVNTEAAIAHVCLHMTSTFAQKAQFIATNLASEHSS